jgi:ribulose-5-phosphate 4-epimerase/fuculose-1-phosphate aldolase
MSAIRPQLPETIRQELVHFGKVLHEYGYIAATNGNLSVRGRWMGTSSAGEAAHRANLRCTC